MKQSEFITSAQFMGAVIRRAEKISLPRVPDPLARAYEVILFDWQWPSALTMYQLLRALTGTSEEFFHEEEDVFDEQDLAIAAALIRANREGRCSEPELNRVLETLENLVEQLD